MRLAEIVAVADNQGHAVLREGGQGEQACDEREDETESRGDQVCALFKKIYDSVRTWLPQPPAATCRGGRHERQQ